MRPNFSVRLLSIALAATVSMGLVACGDKGKSDDSSSSAVGGGDQKSRIDALVAGSSKGQAKVIKTFEATDDGIVGLVVEINGQKQIVYSSPNQKVLFLNGINAAGEPTNEKDLERNNVFISATELAEQVGGKGFIVGKAGPIVTAFMDPNCVFCHKFYTEIMPSVSAGKLRLRIMMVGFLRADSAGKAAAILASSDKPKALDKHERTMDAAKETGGITPLAAGSKPELDVILAENRKLMELAGPVSTPALVLCQKSGPAYLKGAPTDIPGMLLSLDAESSIKSCNTP